MATAAVVDASHKDRRRKDLDQRIIEARKDLARVLRDSSLADCHTALNAEGQGIFQHKGDASAGTYINTVSFRKVVEGLNAICISQGKLLQLDSRTKQRDSYLSWLHEQFGLRRRWWTQRPAANAGLDDIEEALLAEERALTDGGIEQDKQREPQTPLQFAKMTEATNRLVDELLAEANRLGHPDDMTAQKASMESLDSPWTAMRMLRSDGYPMYRHPDLVPEATVEARLAANTAMRKIFQDWEYTRAYGPQRTAFLSGLRQPEANWYQKRIKFWVAKLCYNLLVSTAPPSIHNYNALIIGFTRVGEHSLAGLVVNSFLYQSRLRPTQQTLVCLLQHYRANGDLVGFYRVIRRLVAVDSRGVKIRRRTLADLKLRPHLMVWTKTNDVAIADKFAVQRANIDGTVFYAIFTGLLSLGQVRHAAVAFAKFLSDCCEINAGTLNRLANCVLDAVDAPAARALLQGFVENAGLITPLLMSEERYARKLSIKIQLLLSVATASEPSWRVGTQHQSLDHGSYTPADDSYQRVACALFVSDALQYMKRLDQIVLAAQGAVAADAESLRSSAGRWSIQFDSLHKRQQTLDRQRLLYRKMAELKAVDEAAEAIFASCAYVMETFLDVVCSSTNVPTAYRSFLLQSQLPFAVRFASYLATMPETASPSTEEGQQQALLEHHIAVDGPAVGRLLEDRLKQILLLYLSPEQCAAAGIDKRLSAKNAVEDIALSAVLIARSYRDQSKIVKDADVDIRVELPASQAGKEGAWNVEDFGSQYPYGLFRARAMLSNS